MTIFLTILGWRVKFNESLICKFLEPRSIVSGTLNRRVRSSRRVAVQITIEPVRLPLYAFDEVYGFPRAREVVVLAWEEDYLTRHAKVLKSPEPLFALLNGDAEIQVGVENERWSFHVLDIFQRRRIPVRFESIEDVAAEILGVSIRAVACPIVADEVRDAAQCHGGLEPSRVADDPIRHESTIAAPGNTEPILVDP